LPRVTNLPLPVYCFSWVHLDDYSQDCYQTFAQCKVEEKQKALGHRLTLTKCEKRDRAACMTVTPDRTLRCFGDANSCVSYRITMINRGLDTTACVYQDANARSE
jgi:hypothetical protein